MLLPNNINNNIKSMEPNSEKMRPQKFDIDQFNKNNDDGMYLFTTSDSIEVKQVVNSDRSSGKVNHYNEHRNYINSPYTYYNRYDASGNLTLTSTSFIGVQIGIAKWYDTLGNVIKEEDADIGYPFSIDMLIHKMKEEYGVDLLNWRGYINRGQDEEYLHIPTYEVYSIVEETVPYNRARNNGEVLYYNRTYRKAYLIDGNTGVVLYITDMPLWETDEDDYLPILEQYLNSLKDGGPDTTGLNSNGLNGVDTLEDEDLPEI